MLTLLSMKVWSEQCQPAPLLLRKALCKCWSAKTRNQQMQLRRQHQQQHLRRLRQRSHPVAADVDEAAARATPPTQTATRRLHLLQVAVAEKEAQHWDIFIHSYRISAACAVSEAACCTEVRTTEAGCDLHSPSLLLGSFSSAKLDACLVSPAPLNEEFRHLFAPSTAGFMPSAMGRLLADAKVIVDSTGQTWFTVCRGGGPLRRGDGWVRARTSKR